MSLEDIPSQNDINDFPEFSDIFIPQVDCNVGLLIGNDNLPVLQPHDVITTPSGCYAAKTLIGWVVYLSKIKPTGGYPKTFFARTVANQLCNMCSDFVDSIKKAKGELSVEETRFMASVESSISHQDDGHYEISLPLRKANLIMSYNKPQAEQRASYLKRRLQKDPKLLQDYRTFMDAI